MNDQQSPESPDELSPTIPDSTVAELKAMIDNAQRIVAFTGAGISAESGIPTYRGAGGMWTKFDPEKYASIEYFRKDPTYYWNFFRDVRHDTMATADPNGAHLAMVDLEARGKLSAVITQNIDGLHIKAGSKRVLELHGNTTRFYCVSCRNEYNLEQVWEMLKTQLPPLCEGCGAVLRPDVVLFGEMLPETVLNQAVMESEQCDLMIVVGSSLVIYPAAGLPYQAKYNGAKLVIINIDPTPMDGLADMVIHLPAAELLRRAVPKTA